MAGGSARSGGDEREATEGSLDHWPCSLDRISVGSPRPPPSPNTVWSGGVAPKPSHRGVQGSQTPNPWFPSLTLDPFVSDGLLFGFSSLTVWSWSFLTVQCLSFLICNGGGNGDTPASSVVRDKCLTISKVGRIGLAHSKCRLGVSYCYYLFFFWCIELGIEARAFAFSTFLKKTF